jgi:sec-independent protein translocase protein TatC
MALPDDNEEGILTKPFLEHLADLRKALVWSACIVLVAAVGIVPFVPSIIQWLKLPIARAGLDPNNCLTTLTVMGGLNIVLKTVLWGAILVSAPFVFWAIAWFVFPGLTRRERRAVIVAAVVSAVLFATGVILGYCMMPYAITVFVGINAWAGTPSTVWDMAAYVTFTIRMLLAFGVVFELPIVVMALGYIGIVDSGMLRATRRHVFVGMLILAAIVTPQQDPFSMLALALPLALLHEACIWILWARERRSAREPA